MSANRLASEPPSMAISPDGRWLASGTQTKVTIWDAETGQPVHRLEGHTGSVTCVAFSPDSQRLASAAQDLVYQEAARASFPRSRRRGGDSK